jgi:hypothetical protein
MAAVLLRNLDFNRIHPSENSNHHTGEPEKMQKNLKLFLAAAGLAVLYGCAGSGGQTASDSACVVPKAEADMSIDDLKTLYDCKRPELVAGYQKKGHPIASVYTEWQAASRAPQAPGMHSQQYLMTYVNPTGYSEYVRFATADADMPTGTVIAKEAFRIKGKKVVHGPLLFMEKVGMDAAPDTGGWKYSGIKPNGGNLKVDEKGFCHACHQAWPGQDFLGYPLPAVRASAQG